MFFLRREFLEKLALASGLPVVSPIFSACSSSGSKLPSATSSAGGEDPLALPLVPPPDWDAVAFNRKRANAGAVPSNYLSSINGPDGDVMHIGKHLPYVPTFSSPIPEGMIPLMFGDSSKGRPKHGNAAPSEQMPAGHFYDWIRIRKATSDESPEQVSTYSSWPTTLPQDTGRITAKEGTDPTIDGGKNTVYLALLPPNVRSGDLVRVHAHCNLHGEYVDFLVVP
ncbi:MAG: hypothetical protein RMJ84_01245 [Sandaracinaceae bacterium]|nr:hypothetical protein [Sandaracinaceae bacterium]